MLQHPLVFARKYTSNMPASKLVCTQVVGTRIACFFRLTHQLLLVLNLL